MTDSNAKYTTLPASDVSIQVTASEPHATSYAYYVVPRERRHQKRCGGCCCCSMIILGLLLFFLIPRKPSIAYKGTYLNDDIANEISSMDIAALANQSDYLDGKFKFVNWNFFGVDWEDLSVSQYWLTQDETLGDCDLTKTAFGVKYCGYQMGQFEKSNEFSTNGRTISNLNVPLAGYKTVNIATMLLSCAINGEVLLLSKGSVKASTSLHDFGKENLGDQLTYLVCQ